jgi:P-aminobenzoate N-oxygenase AurF
VTTDASRVAIADDEVRVERAALDDDAWASLVHRLNRQSIDKRHDAYTDIDWDHPDFAIDPDDPRFIGAAEVLVGNTQWWIGLTDQQRSRLGLHLIAHRMRSGLVFENVLTRGLLAHALTLPNGSPEFRYQYHEIIEESQHTLMFQEFVNRTGFDTGRLPLRLRLAVNRVIGFATTFPELFFVFVLGGEDPIDHVQREALRNGADHPLLERIMRIHVTEEARHLSFARHQLKRRADRLGRIKRTALTYAAPLVLAQMADQMMGLPADVVRTHRIPADVVKHVRSDPARSASVNESLTKVRRLLRDCGLITNRSQRLWRRLGLEA